MCNLKQRVAQSCPTLVTPWTVARQAPLSMGFLRQEYWSGLPFPSPGNLPDSGIKLTYEYVSCIGRWILYCLSYQGSQQTNTEFINTENIGGY